MTTKPTSLKNHILQQAPHLDDPRLDSLIELAINNINIPEHRQYKARPDCFFMPYTVPQKLFGRDYKRYLSDTGLISISGDYSKNDGLTYPYQVTDLFIELVLSDPIPMKLLDEPNLNTSSFQTVYAPKHAVEAMDTRTGRTKRRTTLQLPSLVPLGVNKGWGLQAKYEEWNRTIASHDSPGGVKRKAKRLVATSNILLRQFVACRSTGQVGLIQRYSEHASGRLYSHGLSLQNVPKDLRQALFWGHTEWDFDSCHPAILCALGEQYGIPAPTLSFYVANKDPMRLQISAKTGIGLKAVKSALTALMYGASLRDKPGNALRDLLGSGGLRVIIANDVFRGIANEMSALKEAIIERHLVKTNRGLAVRNPLGKDLHLGCREEEKAEMGTDIDHGYTADNSKGKTVKPSSLLAHILQGYEAAMLNTVICRLSPPKGYDSGVRLLQHDGWTTKQSSLEGLSAALDEIEQKLHIPIEVSHQYLS